MRPSVVNITRYTRTRLQISCEHYIYHCSMPTLRLKPPSIPLLTPTSTLEFFLMIRDKIGYPPPLQSHPVRDVFISRRTTPEGQRSVIGAEDPLSNFWNGQSFFWNGVQFCDREHAIVAEKISIGYGMITVSMEEDIRRHSHGSPGKAKAYGRSMCQGKDEEEWHKRRANVVFNILISAAFQDLDFLGHLLRDHIRSFDHPTSDPYWGSLHGGQNAYGKLLSYTRDVLIEIASAVRLHWIRPYKLVASFGGQPTDQVYLGRVPSSLEIPKHVRFLLDPEYSPEHVHLFRALVLSSQESHTDLGSREPFK